MLNSFFYLSTLNLKVKYSTVHKFTTLDQLFLEIT